MFALVHFSSGNTQTEDPTMDNFDSWQIFPSVYVWLFGIFSPMMRSDEFLCQFKSELLSVAGLENSKWRLNQKKELTYCDFCCLITCSSSIVSVYFEKWSLMTKKRHVNLLNCKISDSELTVVCWSSHWQQSWGNVASRVWKAVWEEISNWLIHIGGLVVHVLIE